MHNQEFDARVCSATKIAIARVKRSAPSLDIEICKDIAQATIIEVHRDLFDDNWKNIIKNCAFQNLKKVVRVFGKEERMKEKYEQVNAPRLIPNEVSRAEFNQLLERCLTPREFQAIHHKFWRGETKKGLSVQMGTSFKRAYELINNGKAHIKQALHRHGVTKYTWQDWFYE